MTDKKRGWLMYRTRKTKKECYENLANEIILSAVKDYKHALKHNKKSLINDCERFFRSGWFATLTEINADKLIKNLRREAQNDNKRNKVVV